MTAPSPQQVLADLTADRVLAIVRAPGIADAGALRDALAAGGIRCMELTFTIPDVLRHLERAASAAGGDVLLGAGTVRSAGEARDAVSAGATFLVAPDVNEQVAEAARDLGVAYFPGAMTPTEVARAETLGATAVKVFPAATLGARFLRDLAGPFPQVPLLPSGGITEQNAADFLSAGAVAVAAGTGVVPPDAVAGGDWADITARARSFRSHL
ncbi:2-dehydro-3-deoxyphosphogluconate aldolase/(4S)-4-hydroxy-2-oxoglutarate aldolase [Barrientosiimonas humi]|uniref:2-dehydro-3-deoxyphosphogluconate aldolase/(4S)-4-hydroxy-2-oxoglutarate aldolase n=1 Tax=Barrientosiimonas humi TaxID=999931 RepID=A0A542WZ59_9MICO|nr:bifunctional 4-hydroxy-2-oxoglutarate aldolase/2-dehydro-3-deoxy-phosphogluconate aldolase [Barrientosiimonas humi]TQL28868.1 2-dehydro-3-deoxyphosphogluconate aldolase/(4S)-4-hydroxy-2-oxoglutarate aldolase [Barrientosiimonas humi]TQL34983.1 2-dehydro-3-deoxyphosphogluconate aldolase/(4S)-4-hydroxy-2-oxoglutarate aldolase [Barrientosiimonas humi]CAG7571197.1 KHG/KDPG aldolase [Barrientosiimonas humi]